MKKKMVVLGMLLMLIFGLSAQSLNDEINVEIQREIEEAMKEKDEAMKIIQIKMDKNLSENSSDSFMGIYLSDMCFKDAYDMRYKFNYGVLVKDVVASGPAQNAGLMKGDVIMEFAGEKAYHDSYLSQLIKMQPAGKKVPVKFYRYDTIYETELVIGSRKEFYGKGTETQETKPGLPTKKKLSVGYGGGSWIPVWYQPDVKEINTFLRDLGFKGETFSENGFLMHGGGGKGNVGKGWFLGGMGAGYDNEETTKHAWIHMKEGILDTTVVSRKAEYDVSFGGVTLDKRMALSKNLITSLGFMIGGGSHGYKITQKDSNIETTNFDFTTNPSDQMDNTYQYVSSLKMRKSYMIFQPKVMAMYRILSWLSFRAEVGYMASYSSKGWEVERNGEKIKGENIPSANMDGLTFSIGPWFGF